MALGRSVKQRSLLFASLVTFGAVIEWFQHLIYNGRFETWDVRDDCIGSCVGLALTLILERLAQPLIDQRNNIGRV